MTNYRISFQLYSARNFPPVEAQLEALAAIGFDAVEPFGGVYEADPKGFRAMLDKYKLPAVTAHMPVAALDEDRAKFIETAGILGVETVCLPYLAADQRPTDLAGWKAFGARLSGHAAALAAAGYKLAWHNHDFEYEKLPDGSRPIDHIVGAAGVMFEPDIAWIVRAGDDPKTEIAKFPGKVAAIHVKDTAPAGVTKDDGWTDVGAGTIDWKALWPAIAASGADVLVLEHDNPSDWKGYAKRSHKYVKDLIAAKKG
jgi:sugar phosphate isomerase/epimerase